MGASNQREELIRFLDRKVFDPILHASHRSRNEQRRLKQVQHNTESEKRRFHSEYRTAKEVRENYLSDLNSRTAHRVNSELEDLNLPTLPSVKDEFLSLCDNLGVH